MTYASSADVAAQVVLARSSAEVVDLLGVGVSLGFPEEEVLRIAYSLDRSDELIRIVALDRRISLALPF